MCLFLLLLLEKIGFWKTRFHILCHIQNMIELSYQKQVYEFPLLNSMTRGDKTIPFLKTNKMRLERHARTRFISSKSTLVNFQQGWKKKPQVAMKLPDFCLAPLESSLLSKLLYPPPNPSVGCWDPRAWSVYLSKRPTYACAKNVAILCLFMSFWLERR